MSETAHTVHEALAKFDLIAGSTGNETEGKACAMSMLSWIAGEAWTDHPPCAHRLLADMAIRANDNENTTPEQREGIVRAGCDGIIDTWWVPTTVIVLAIAEAPKGLGVVDRALAVFAAVAGWKSAEPKASPDLTDAYLYGADLTGANLYGANLTGANLTDANLTDANLYGADLTRANLTDANLYGADLTGANLYGANLTGANLYGANLTDANLYGAYLARANLTDANLSGAYLARANLTDANLSGANLTGAYLARANLTDANLSGADLTRANLTGANLTDANLTRADLTDARGNAYTQLPAGWVVQKATGLIVPATETEVAG